MRIATVRMHDGPWGCGYFMDPSRTLEIGDVVECEVERIACCVAPSPRLNGRFEGR